MLPNTISLPDAIRIPSTRPERNIDTFYKLIKKLHPEFEEKRPIAVIGAGVSAQANLANWDQLLDKFHTDLTDKHAKKRDIEFLEKVKELEDRPWKAEEYCRLSSKERLHEIISTSFSGKQFSPTHELLIQLEFSHFLTTNYDHLLEDAAKDENLDTVDWALSYDKQRFFKALDTSRNRQLVYLHGRLGSKQHESLIITESDYVNRYVKTDETNRELFSLFLHQPIVFIGYSLNDPELTSLLRIANSHRGELGSNHIALLAFDETVGDDTLKAREFNGKYGIQPLFYNPGNNFENLPILLESILSHQKASVETINSSIEHYIADELKSTNDPNHGKYGGQTSSNALRVEAEVMETAYLGWYQYCIRITGPKNITGTATIYLDPDTYLNNNQHTVDFVNGIAKYTDSAYGAFTVGIECDFSKEGISHKTTLEIDLSSIPTAPLGFRIR